jgi:hypothetical protein
LRAIIITVPRTDELDWPDLLDELEEAIVDGR